RERTETIDLLERHERYAHEGARPRGRRSVAHPSRSQPGHRGPRRVDRAIERSALREQTDARVQPPRLQVGEEREHRALGAPALERCEEEQRPRRRVRLLRHQGVTVAHEDSRSRELLVERFELASRDLPREGVTNVLTTAGGELRGTLRLPAKLLD